MVMTGVREPDATSRWTVRTDLRKRDAVAVVLSRAACVIGRTIALMAHAAQALLRRISLRETMALCLALDVR